MMYGIVIGYVVQILLNFNGFYEIICLLKKFILLLQYKKL